MHSYCITAYHSPLTEKITLLSPSVLFRLIQEVALMLPTSACNDGGTGITAWKQKHGKLDIYVMMFEL